MFKKNKIVIDYELLPDIIATLEKPSSPLGSFMIWLVFLLFSAMIVISIVGKVDTVASTTGKIIPKENFNIIHSSQEGIINKIWVKEGQSVKKGEVLVSFNSDLNKEEVIKTQKMIEICNFENLLLKNELNEIMGKKISELNLTKYSLLKRDEIDRYIEMKSNREEQYLNKKKKYELEKESQSENFKILDNELETYQRKLTLLNKEVENAKTSFDFGVSTEFEYKSKVQEAGEIKDKIEITKHKLAQITSEITGIQKNIELLNKERKDFLLTKISDNDKTINQLLLELIKFKKSEDLTIVRAPESGRVNKISINNFNGFIQNGTELMTIVPQNSILQAEVYIQNKDIGFVKMGQEVELKLDAYQFQDYGMLKGKVINLSPDTITENGKDTYVYKAYISIEKNELNLKNKNEAVKVGMTLKGEIKTEKRRIIDFILSPIKKSLRESMSIR